MTCGEVDGGGHGSADFTLTLEELKGLFRADSEASAVTAADRDPSLTITEYGDGRIVGWSDVTMEQSRKGGTVAGLTIFRFFDSMGYMVTLAQSPRGTEAFTSDLSIHFLRPGPVGRFIVEGRPMRFGRRGSVVSVAVSSVLVPAGPVASGVITFAPRFPS